LDKKVVLSTDFLIGTFGHDLLIYDISIHLIYIFTNVSHLF